MKYVIGLAVVAAGCALAALVSAAVGVPIVAVGFIVMALGGGGVGASASD